MFYVLEGLVDLLPYVCGDGLGEAVPASCVVVMGESVWRIPPRGDEKGRVGGKGRARWSYEEGCEKGSTGFRLTLSRDLDRVAYTHCLAVMAVFPDALAEAFVVEVLKVRHSSLSSFFSFFFSLPPEQSK